MRYSYLIFVYIQVERCNWGKPEQQNGERPILSEVRQQDIFILCSYLTSEPSLSARWNSYETNLLSTFEGLLDSEALSDVTLFCEGQY